MKDMLVGYTGFVGSNIASKHKFEWNINTKNKAEAFEKKPELLVYAGIRAEKYLANQNPGQDRKIIEEAFNQIKKIHAEQIVLISTVDVYKMPFDVYEDSEMETNELHPYGMNRFILENMVREYNSDALIVRLPGLFGKNLKKNFIYDLIHDIPSALKEEKLNELCKIESVIREFYQKQDNGFYTCNFEKIDQNGKSLLQSAFKRTGFSTLNFTDSRNIYQFYNLERLWDDIQLALKLGVKILNITTEPVSSAEVYENLTGKKFFNEILREPVVYNVKSRYAHDFGGENGYFINKEEILEEIGAFVTKYETVNI